MKRSCMTIIRKLEMLLNVYDDKRPVIVDKTRYALFPVVPYFNPENKCEPLENAS